MKNTACTQSQWNSGVTPRALASPLTEADILFLSDTFTTPGFHYITVADINSGRQLIKTFLQFIPAHSDIACLTLDETQRFDGFINVYTVLSAGSFTAMEESLLQLAYSHFLCIEATDQLKKMHWFAPCMQAITDLKMNQNMPVFVLSYTKGQP